jgi:phage shock protein A
VDHVQAVELAFRLNDLALAFPLLVQATCEVDFHLTSPEEDVMSAAVVALDPCTQGTESVVVELRREALRAVVRQQQVREELAAIRAHAIEIERRAARALARGDDLAGRQILARGMFMLHTRDALEAELAECRANLARLLATMVRAEDRAWRAAHPAGSWRG